jgi:hypothetical protein
VNPDGTHGPEHVTDEGIELMTLVEERIAHERDYLERTIATVRNHRDADDCWPSWANIFADEIERLWKIEDAHTREER